MLRKEVFVGAFADTACTLAAGGNIAERWRP